MAVFDDFMKLDIRVGTILEAKDFPNARKPAYQLLIDFGPDKGNLPPRLQYSTGKRIL